MVINLMIVFIVMLLVLSSADPLKTDHEEFINSYEGKTETEKELLVQQAIDNLVNKEVG